MSAWDEMMNADGAPTGTQLAPLPAPVDTTDPNATTKAAGALDAQRQQITQQQQGDNVGRMSGAQFAARSVPYTNNVVQSAPPPQSSPSWKELIEGPKPEPVQAVAPQPAPVVQQIPPIPGIDDSAPVPKIPPIPGLDTPTPSTPTPSKVDFQAPRADLSKPFINTDAPFRVSQDGVIAYDPNRLLQGLQAARDSGAISNDKFAELAPKAQAAQDAAKQQADLLANDTVASKLKALGVGATKGAAFLAGAAPGAEAGAAAGALIPGLEPVTVPLGSAIGGAITGGAAAWGAGKILKKLGDYSDTIKSFTDAADAHPYYDAAGNLIAFGSQLPKTVAGIAGDVATRAASGASPVSQAIGAGSIVAAHAAANAAVDTVIKEGAKALGLSDQGQTLPGAAQAALIGAFISGHGIKIENYQPHEVGDILTRARDAQTNGVDINTVLTPKEQEVAKAAASEIQKRVNSGEAAPGDVVSAQQSTLYGKPYGVTSAAIERPTGEAPPTQAAGLGGPVAPTEPPSTSAPSAPQPPGAVEPATAPPGSPTLPEGDVTPKTYDDAISKANSDVQFAQHRLQLAQGSGNEELIAKRQDELDQTTQQAVDRVGDNLADARSKVAAGTHEWQPGIGLRQIGEGTVVESQRATNTEPPTPSTPSAEPVSAGAEQSAAEPAPTPAEGLQNELAELQQRVQRTPESAMDAALLKGEKGRIAEIQSQLIAENAPLPTKLSPQSQTAGAAESPTIAGERAPVESQQSPSTPQRSESPVSSSPTQLATAERPAQSELPTPSQPGYSVAQPNVTNQTTAEKEIAATGQGAGEPTQQPVAQNGPGDKAVAGTGTGGSGATATGSGEVAKTDDLAEHQTEPEPYHPAHAANKIKKMARARQPDMDRLQTQLEEGDAHGGAISAQHTPEGSKIVFDKDELAKWLDIVKSNGGDETKWLDQTISHELIHNRQLLYHGAGFKPHYTELWGRMPLPQRALVAEALKGNPGAFDNTGKIIPYVAAAEFERMVIEHRETGKTSEELGGTKMDALKPFLDSPQSQQMEDDIAQVESLTSEPQEAEKPAPAPEPAPAKREEQETARGPPEEQKESFPVVDETTKGELAELFKGLHASKPEGPGEEKEQLRQMPFPKERRKRFYDLADTLDKQGVRTPERLAEVLDYVSKGTLRRYSQALWDIMGSAGIVPRGTFDWPKIYGTTPEEKNRHKAAEISDEVSDALKNLPGDAQERASRAIGKIASGEDLSAAERATLAQIRGYAALNREIRATGEPSPGLRGQTSATPALMRKESPSGSKELAPQTSTETAERSASVQRRIAGPALTDPSGNVIARGPLGATHAELKRDEIREGNTDAADAEHSFLDDQGNVLNRRDAMKVAREAGQLRPDVDSDELQSEHLKPEEPPSLFASKPFYSQLTRTIEALPQETMTVAQAKAAIEKNAKRDEIEQQGIFKDPLSPLYGKNDTIKVSKSELVSYALERQSDVKDVVLGGYSPDSVARAFSDSAELKYGQNSNSWPEDVFQEWRRLEDKRVTEAAVLQTKFAQYQTPGADTGSYREMFVTWPRDKTKENADELKKQWGEVRHELKGLDELGFDNTNEAWRAVLTHDDYKTRWDVPDSSAAILDAFKNRKIQDTGWKDGHSSYESVQNPIVRIRRNIRTDAAGKKTYFIEEMQGPSATEQAKMPEALRKRIYEIGMKRAVRDASAEGADNIGWTTGEQQAERYDLSKHVSAINYEKNSDGTFNIEAISNEGPAREIGSKIAAEKLSDYVGKEAAEKIKNDQGHDNPKDFGPSRTLSGVDLRVGGEGLRRLYDVTMPRIANELARRFGVKTGAATITPAQDAGAGYEIGPEGVQPKGTQAGATIHLLPIPEAWKREAPSFALYASKPSLAQRITSLSDASGWTSLVDDIQKVLAPDERLTPEEREKFIATGNLNSIGDARKTGNLLRGITAEMDRRKKQWEAALKEGRTLVDKLPTTLKKELMMRMDEQTPLKEGPYKAAVDALADLDAKKTQALKDWFNAHGMEHWQNFENFEKYMVPHYFSDQQQADKVVQAMMRQKKMQGGTGFLKHRKEFTMREVMDFAASQGIKLEPKHENVFDAVMDRWAQQERYQGAHEMIDRMEKNGTGHWEFVDYNPRVGEKMVNNIIGNRTTEVPSEKEGEPPTRRRQHFFANEPSARIINNYLSRGLRADHKWIEHYFAAANLLNSAQLGLSFFHGGFVTMEGMVSSFALGLNKMMTGDMSGAKDIAMAPFSTWNDWKLGSKIRDEMLNPGKYGEQHQAVVNAMVEAGFRDGLDSFYKNNNVEKLMTALRDKKYGAPALQAPLAMIEYAAKPIMEHFVPRMKAAAIYKLAQMHLKNNPNMPAEQLHDLLSRDVESGNNRFGQMTYDNLHLHKTVKDLLMGVTRSLGWNWGTFSELGGGVYDWARWTKDVARHIAGGGGGKGSEPGNPDAPSGDEHADRAFPRVTNKMAYVLALPLLVGIMGAVLSAFFRQKPEQLKDYYFVKTGENDERGNPLRVVLPTYMKDVFHAARDPISTITNKLHPLLSTMAQMFQNKDFYGVEIRHSGDPVIKQILEELGYAGKQLLPFTWRNESKLAQSNAPLALKAASLVGVTQAPSDANKTDAELLAQKINMERRPTGSRTSEDAEHSRIKAKLTGLMRNGKGEDEMAAALQSGQISQKDVASIERASRMTPLQAAVSHMNGEDAERVLEKATPEERAQLEPMIAAKKAKVEKQIVSKPDNRSTWDKLWAA